MAQFIANRRGVLIGGVASLGALIFKVPRLTAADTIRVRPDASTTEGKEMLKVYAKAVEAMKQKPAHEPTSWWFQANLHWLPPRGGGGNDPIWGTQQPAALDKIFAAPANADQATRDRLAKLRKLALDSLQGATSPFGPNRAWATCPHHEPAFLVWHRLYVVLFEDAVERVAHDIGALPAASRFALPYWNYLVDRKLPEAFRVPGDESNPLFVALRTPEANGGRVTVDNVALEGRGMPVPGGWPVASQRVALLGSTQFSETLANAPHDTVHGRVGSGGWMGDPATAARDPIFWLHHAQIDRLWESWRKSDHGPDPSDATPEGRDWNKALFRFVSLSAEADVRQAHNVIDATALGYRYDKLEDVPTVIAAGPIAEPSAVAAAGVPIAAAASPVTIGAATVRVPLVPSEAAPAGAEPLSKASGELALRMVDIRGAVDPGTDYDVFIQPKGASGEPSGEPIGRFNLFGRIHSMPDEQMPGAAPASEGVTVAMPLTESIASAGVSELRPEDLVITIRPNAKPAGDIVIGKVELVVK